jgi:hypothetical protein
VGGDIFRAVQTGPKAHPAYRKMISSGVKLTEIGTKHPSPSSARLLYLSLFYYHDIALISAGNKTKILASSKASS